MSREIKFRSWVKEKQELIYDFGIVYNPTFQENEKRILMQYTGLKDKNCKEIYEGDILQRQAHQDFFVDFHEGYYCVKSTNKIQQINWTPMKLIELLGYDYEVVGNIYENPEMLDA